MGYLVTGKPIKRVKSSLARTAFLKKKKLLHSDTSPNPSTPTGRPTLSPITAFDKPEIKQTEDPEASILERFPKEIILQIFIHIGFENNNLPLASKYFSDLFRLNINAISSTNTLNTDSTGLNFLKILLRDERFCLYDLNARTNLLATSEKIGKYKQKYTASLVNSTAINEAFTRIEESIRQYQENTFAYPVALFNRKFMTLAVVNSLPPTKVMEEAAIASEITQRHSNLILQGRNLLKLLRETLPNTSLDALAYNAQEQFDMADTAPESGSGHLGDVLSLDASSHELKDLKCNFPSRFYKCPITHERYSLILQLSTDFQLAFCEVDRAILSYLKTYDIKSSDIEFYVLITTILDLGNASTLSVEPIVEALKTFNEFGETKHETLWSTISYLLETYYRRMNATGNPEEDSHDDDLWIYLSESKRSDFLDLVCRFKGKRGHQKLLRFMST